MFLILYLILYVPLVWCVEFIHLYVIVVVFFSPFSKRVNSILDRCSLILTALAIFPTSSRHAFEEVILNLKIDDVRVTCVERFSVSETWQNHQRHKRTAPSMTEVFSIDVNIKQAASLPPKSTFGLNEVLYNNCLDRWSSASDCRLFFCFFLSPAIFCNRHSEVELVKFFSSLVAILLFPEY